MSDLKHPIGYCDETANPFHGCEHDCPFCFARRFAIRHGGNPAVRGYRDLKMAGLHPFAPAFSQAKLDALSEHLRRARQPRRVFIGDMGDLGGDWDYRAYGALGLTDEIMPADHVREAVRLLVSEHERHTFLILTKNPCGLAGIRWPANAHVGTSVSDTAEAWMRCERLVDSVEAQVRWVSVEPLLDAAFDAEAVNWAGIRWVVVGFQTGPGRDGTIEHMRAVERIVDLCARDGVPCFVKDNVTEFTGRTWPREFPA